ncbi:SusC/RagA family TonB-linked outer membrane protein [Winogradskyella costae]|uniref:SusC/RagA family TonB-linked outer membrane protein n=1 Tax=Winogradskyella costae TaxID=2697008 RepID=UPI0015C6D2C4|nr:SusC/RagA family TonB-linked outer membrane protein [Winogradskyella costae]
MQKNIIEIGEMLYLPKLSLKMKLTSILLFFTLLQIHATSNSQNVKISLDCNEMKLESILSQIEKKTDFKFLYEKTILDKDKLLNISTKNEKLSSVLKTIFDNTDIDYRIVKKQIVLRRNQENPIKLNASVAQSKITGTVRDKNGMSLPGATVLEKGTNNGVITDLDGNYSLSISQSAVTMVVSFIGYETKEIEAKNGDIINIVLQESVTGLEEAVIIGYGKVKRENLTGSVGTVDMKNITSQAPTVNLDNALQGQIAGVNVTSSSGQPGAAARIRIRGTTSLLGSNQPLYVIDGIPVAPNSNIPTGGSEGNNLGSELNQEGISTPIGNINTSDIESISVLKDASAAAIYGSRAANGVIIINTRQGTFSSKTKFQLNISTSTQSAQTLDVLNASQFRNILTTAVGSGTRDDAFTRSVLDGSYFGDADTNWEDELSPGAPISSNYNLNIRGGSEKSRYSMTLGVNTQDGVYNNTGFNRYNFSTNLDTKINDNWTFGSKVNISSSDQDAVDGGLTQLIYDFRPDVPVFDTDGNYSFSPQYTQENPVARSKALNNNKTFLLLGSIYTELKLAEGLNFKTLFSLNYNDGNQKSFYPEFTFVGGWDRNIGNGDGYAQESRSRSASTLFQNTLSYDKLIGKHNISAVIGASFEKNKISNVKVWGEGFSNEVLTNISSATVFSDGSSYETYSGLASYFGRVNYDFDDKYLLTLSARVDGSSKFAKDNQYAFFPAAAAAWRLSNEEFLINVDFIDELKLRASIGTTGQQDFGDYAWRTLFEGEDYGPDPSVIITQLGNDKLKWERTEQIDFGLDFTLFRGRFSGGVGYYSKETKDALFTSITPGNTGYNRIIANIGNTKNSGVELELKGDIITSKNFNWNVSFNISKNENKLTKISDDFRDEDGFLTGFPGGGRLKEGSPIGLIYGYVAEGLFQDQNAIDALNAGSPSGVYQNIQTAPGDLKFKDLTGPDGVPDGIITNLDQTVIGDTQPDFFGGFNNTFQYKGFALSTFFTFSVGNDIEAFGLARGTNFGSTFIGENKETSVLNAWTPENRDTNIPRSVYYDPNNNDRTSSHYVYDASYIRLKTLSFSYTFSKKDIEQLQFLDTMSIFFSAQNLFTITDYPGADPEASNLFNNDISSGRDNNRFPISKVFTMGLNIAF